MNNELMDIEKANIKNLIHTIRGKQVMLDSDVAMFYEYETKYINLAVKRNKERFPEDFYFQLTSEEFKYLRLQFATLNKSFYYGKRKYLPYAFTEQGIAMLAPLLKNEISVQVSIKIMKAFVGMRKFININRNLFERVVTIENRMDEKFIDYDNKFDKVFNALQKDENFKQKIFFEGQIYDAYSLIIDIIKKAEREIIIIDNYVDDSILKMLAKKNKGVEVLILTSEKSNISELDIQKFNEEPGLLEVEKTSRFHDRFIIIDKKLLYHCGASIKDLGKKCFAINKIEDESIIDNFIISMV